MIIATIALAAAVLTPTFDPGAGVYAYAFDPHTDGTTYYCGNPATPWWIADTAVRHTPDGDDIVALAPTPGAWDSRHVCDPDVIAGEFGHDGHTYRWAMFYTGTADPWGDGTQNSVGIALSDDQTEWVHLDRPLIPNPKPGTRAWGVGQPSAIPMFDQSTVLLTWTGPNEAAKSAGVFAQIIDLADVDHPVTISGPWWTGLVKNADLAVDPAAGVIYASHSGDQSPDGTPAFVSTTEHVDRIPLAELVAGRTGWERVAVIDVDVMTHNSGIITNDWAQTGPELEVIVAGNGRIRMPDVLYTYRPHHVTITTRAGGGLVAS